MNKIIDILETPINFLSKIFNVDVRTMNMISLCLFV